MIFFSQDKKNLQILSSSIMVFVVCILCLSLLDQQRNENNNDSSPLLPLILNTTQPFLITGNIDRLQPQLEQLISGSNIERIDVQGADSLLLASVRNLEAISNSSQAPYEFSAPIVIDDALAATLVIQEYQTEKPTLFWSHMLISFACALATAIVSLMLIRLMPTSLEIPVVDYPKHSEADAMEEIQVFTANSVQSDDNISVPINTAPRGDQRLILMMRISDLADQLVRTDEINNYMDRIWKITDRMAATYGISCIGVQSGLLIFTASASNVDVALRHCIMFGWNLGRQENAKTLAPASFIAPIDFQGENPSYAFALSLNDEINNLIQRLSTIAPGEFCICDAIQSNLPKSVDAIAVENHNLKILSVENRMLDLWRQQIKAQPD